MTTYIILCRDDDDKLALSLDEDYTIEEYRSVEEANKALENDYNHFPEYVVFALTRM
jgi:hypothetical protein